GDHVRRLAHRHEEGEARTAGRRNPGPAGTAGQVNDRRTRCRRGALEANEGDLDRAAAGITPVLRHDQPPELGDDRLPVIGSEEMRMDCHGALSTPGNAGVPARMSGPKRAGTIPLANSAAYAV